MPQQPVQLPRALTPFAYRQYRWLAVGLILSLFADGVWAITLVWQVIGIGGAGGEKGFLVGARSTDCLVVHDPAAAVGHENAVDDVVDRNRLAIALVACSTSTTGTDLGIVEAGAPNLAVEAVAGSGKSSTLIEICNRLPRGTRATVVAFGADIAAHMGKQLPTGRGHQALTAHALCRRAWLRRLGQISA